MIRKCGYFLVFNGSERSVYMQLGRLAPIGIYTLLGVRHLFLSTKHEKQCN